MINKNNAAQYLPFVQALVEGKKVAVNIGHGRDKEIWVEDTDFQFSSPPECYKVMVEPPPLRDIWVNVYKSGSDYEFLGHDSEEKAVAYAAQSSSPEIAVHFREVRE